MKANTDSAMKPNSFRPTPECRSASQQLRRTLSSTNVIESAFSIVETVCRKVKRWRDGDHVERWIASGLLVAEQQFRKVVGYREIPTFIASMQNAPKKPIAKGAAVA
jgi:hypothetical protein